MTDQWVPAPPQPAPPDPPANLPPANSWSPVTPCAAADSPSIADGVIITGVPAIIGSVVGGKSVWSITLNDGQAPANFTIDHYDATGTLIEHPVAIDGTSGDVTLTHDPTRPLGAVTKQYVDAVALADAPSDNTTYARRNGAWNPVVPVTGGTFSGGVAFTSGAIFASPTNLAIGGGTAGQVLAKGAGAAAVLWADPAIAADAPSDGQFYTRQNAAWAVSPGGMTDAPNDGTAYARKSAAWAHLTHTDITDWTASLTPYALAASVPVASATLPLPSGTAAIGTATTYARADHVHPTDAYPHDNRLINGDMRIDQRNGGASGTAAGYTIDRWVFSSSQVGKLAWIRGAPAVNPSGCPYYLFWSVTSAYTPLAADTFAMAQPIEADMVGDFAFGTAGAQPVTLSFWVSSNQTGTFSGSLRNGANNRSYPFTYSTVQGVWTRNVITIPGDTAGAWVAGGNAEAIRVLFDLGSGVNFRGPAGAWASANYVGATGAVQLVAIASATLSITGVKLEIGSVATPFNRQTMAKSMADCQRYWQTTAPALRTTAAAVNGTFDCTVNFPTMRAAPTGALLSLGSPVNTANQVLGILSPNSARFEMVAAAAGDCYSITSIYSLSAEL